MSAETSDDRGRLFVDPQLWADMDRWHEQVADIRATQPVLAVSYDDFEPFCILTRHADVLAVSRDNERWLNTPRSVLVPDDQWQQLLDSGMPLPKSLVHLDGNEHRSHRQVTNEWFKPATVGCSPTRRPTATRTCSATR